MQQVIVYKARPESVLKILGLLRQAGLNPVALDNPDGTQQAYSGFNYLVRIAVPEDEAHKARSILAEWEKSVRPTLDRISHQCSIRLACVLVGFGIIYAVVLFLRKWSVFEIVTLMLALLIFLVYPFVYIYNRRKRRCDPRLPLNYSGENQQSEDMSENSP